jgi:hypothetical protein
MTQESGKPKVTKFRPKAADLARQVHELAKATENIGWSKHVREQMEARDISDHDVLKVLRTGSIEGDIVSGQAAGEWKCKMVARIKGNRDVGVVTVVCDGKRLWLKTAEWEDLR